MNKFNRVTGRRVAERKDEHWNVGAGFPELTWEEFESSCDQLSRCLESHGTVNTQDCDFHIVEDLYADRTHKVYVLTVAKLSTRVIDDLREMIRRWSPTWRILLVREPHSPLGMWVYPDRDEFEYEGLIISSDVENLVERWRQP